MKKKKLTQKKKTKINFRIPMMFRDEPVAQALHRAQKISDLKNLGPSSEVTFQKAGIKTANQFIKLGWKKTMVKLVQLNIKNRHSLYAYALIGALSNTEWNRISEQEKQEAREFTASLKPAKQKKIKVR